MGVAHGVSKIRATESMDNADLEKLKVSPGRLLPKFKASVIEYSVTVSSEVKEVKLSPLTSDSGASYAIKGADENRTVHLAEGQTLDVEVIVTAEDGKSTKTYSLKIRRLSADDATLSQLDVSVGVLQPGFSPLVSSYECYLPSSVDSLSIRAKAEDASMKLAMKDGSPVGTVQLNPGRTLIELKVTSSSGSSDTIYKAVAIKSRPPYTIKLTPHNPDLECAICCGLVHRPTRIKDGPYVYCYSCLEEFTRMNKVDPFTGRALEEEGWMVVDYQADSDLSKESAVCATPSGTVEGVMQQLGSKLLAERQKAAKIEENTQSCPDCSKKVPAEDMPLHKALLCTAHHTISLPKHEVKTKGWEKRLVDESHGIDARSLLAKAKDWEAKYLAALPKPWERPHYQEGKAPLDFLQNAAQCYATALRYAPRELQAHVGLGLVMEEFFYAEELFGLRREVEEGDEEGEAERSSKEEEFLAICQLHGVGPGAPLAVQLKAVEAEFHSLKEAGQSHKADHVQQLYAWKSKKALQASQGSYAVDSESPLYRAKLKMEDAAAVNPSDPNACFHAGRICLLLGEGSTALQYLSAAVALRPIVSPARLCLGLALAAPTAGSHAKKLLLHGLSQYLNWLQEFHETHGEQQFVPAKELHSQTFYRSTNTLFVEGFIRLAELGGHGFLDNMSALLCVTPCVSEANLQHRAGTYHKLLWSALKARSQLLSLLHARKDPSVLKHCKQLSALIANSRLGSTSELREMQMKVFQLGVVLQPSSSEALCHLGGGQLAEFDATSEQAWLKNAELSFRASIAMEGKSSSPTTVPEHLKEQEWWKKRTSSSQAKTEGSGGTKKPTPVAQKAPGAAGGGTKQPAPARGVQSRSQPPARQTGAGRGATGASGARKPAAGGATKPAVRQPGGAVRQPARPGQQKTGVTGAKGVATLGELKSGAGQKPSPSSTATATKPQSSPEKPSTHPSPPPTDSQPPSSSAVKGEINKKTYHPRLGLARALAKSTEADKMKESHALYREVISMAPEFHDAYIELGGALLKSDPMGAVDVYSRFPFSNPPTFDDAFLHGEIVRILMSEEQYEDPRLRDSLIAMGKALGIGVLEKQVSVLEGKFKTKLLKQVYAGVHGKPLDDPDLQAFFKFKCWM